MASLTVFYGNKLQIIQMHFTINFKGNELDVSILYT